MDLFSSLSDDGIALLGCGAALLACGTLMSLSFYLGRKIKAEAKQEQQPAPVNAQVVGKIHNQSRKAA